MITSGLDPYADASVLVAGLPGSRFGVAPHALDTEAPERLWALSEETTGVSL
jgi:hypothetical protein